MLLLTDIKLKTVYIHKNVYAIIIFFYTIIISCISTTRNVSHNGLNFGN